MSCRFCDGKCGKRSGHAKNCSIFKRLRADLSTNFYISRSLCACDSEGFASCVSVVLTMFCRSCYCRSMGMSVSEPGRMCCVLLVSENRRNKDGMLLDLPGGKRDHITESPQDVAVRELEEECQGMLAADGGYSAVFVPSFSVWIPNSKQVLLVASIAGDECNCTSMMEVLDKHTALCSGSADHVKGLYWIPLSSWLDSRGMKEKPVMLTYNNHLLPVPPINADLSQLRYHELHNMLKEVDEATGMGGIGSISAVLDTWTTVISVV